VCQVDEHTLYTNTQPALSGNTWRWSVNLQNFDPAGNKTFYNGILQQTYQVIKAELIVDIDSTYPTYLESVKPVWVDGANGHVKSSLDDGMLRITGFKDSPSNNVFDTITEAHRPDAGMYIPVTLYLQDSMFYQVATLRIGSDGTLRVFYDNNVLPQQDHNIWININVPII
jgi:hypothetical protein